MTNVTIESERTRDRRVRRLRWLAPPLLFAAFLGVYVDRVGGWPAEDLFAIRWDIGHYQSIAESGYDAFPCNARMPEGSICGNAGWLFGWPVVVRAFAPVFGGVEAAIRGLPPLLAFASFAVIFALVLRVGTQAQAILALVGIAGLPGSFYLLTGFPYALAVLLQALYLAALLSDVRGREVALPILAAAISTTYPSACLFALVPAWHALRESRRPLDRRALARVAALVAPFAVGPLAHSAYFWITQGDPLFYLHFQAKYRRTWANPFAVVWTSFAEKSLWNPENLAFLWYAALALFFTARDAAGRIARPELAAYVVLLALFSPATGSIQSIYRHLLLAWPAAIVLATSPRDLVWKIAWLVLGAWISLEMLLPRWLWGVLI